jgi:hypothetical protein
MTLYFSQRQGIEVFGQNEKQTAVDSVIIVRQYQEEHPLTRRPDPYQSS